MTLKRSVLQGGVYLFLRQIVSIILKGVGVIFISRVLGPERYGAYVAAYGVYLYAQSVGQVGIGIYILRHAKDVSDEVYGTASTALVALGIMTMLLVEAILAPLGNWLQVPGTSLVLSVMIFALPFQLMTVPAFARLERDLNYRAVAMVEILGQVGLYAVAIPMIALHFGPVSLAVGLIVQNLTTMVLSHVFAKRFPHFSWNWKLAREILYYAGSFSLANWIWQARGLINPLVTGHFVGAEALGIVGMTIGLLEMLSVVKTIAWRLSVVVLGRYQNDKAKLLQGITEGMLLQSLAVGAILVGFGWVGQIAVPLVFGQRWVAVMDVYPYIALGYFVNAQFTMHTSALSVIHRNMQVAVFYSLNVITLAVVASILVPRIGIVGYGWGEIVALWSYIIVQLYIVKYLGSPNYKVAAIWFVGVAVGLFWRQLGLWTFAVPVLALLSPPSLREIARLVGEFRGKRRETVSEAA